MPLYSCIRSLFTDKTYNQNKNTKIEKEEKQAKAAENRNFCEKQRTINR